MPTKQNFTGQYLDDTGLLYYNARYYDPGIGRFVSADTVVPGNASGGMDGIAVKPLTVAFHEYGFLSKANQENQFGPWFTLSDKERQQIGSPMGPANPQALNRYAYVLNNPVRYIDPSGHALPPGFCSYCGLPWGNIRALHPIAQGAIVVGCYIIGCTIDQTGMVFGPDAASMIPGPMGAFSGRGRVLQTGGNDIKDSTAKALNKAWNLQMHRRDWGRALEALKDDLSIPNGHHGKILDTGDYIDLKTNEVLGNLLEYLP